MLSVALFVDNDWPRIEFSSKNLDNFNWNMKNPCPNRHRASSPKLSYRLSLGHVIRNLATSQWLRLGSIMKWNILVGTAKLDLKRYIKCTHGTQPFLVSTSEKKNTEIHLANSMSHRFLPFHLLDFGLPLVFYGAERRHVSMFRGEAQSPWKFSFILFTFIKRFTKAHYFTHQHNRRCVTQAHATVFKSDRMLSRLLEFTFLRNIKFHSTADNFCNFCVRMCRICLQTGFKVVDFFHSQFSLFSFKFCTCRFSSIFSDFDVQNSPIHLRIAKNALALLK